MDLLLPIIANYYCQFIANYLPYFAEVIECLLVFLLNVLLDLTDRLYVFIVDILLF